MDAPGDGEEKKAGAGNAGGGTGAGEVGAGGGGAGGGAGTPSQHGANGATTVNPADAPPPSAGQKNESGGVAAAGAPDSAQESKPNQPQHREAAVDVPITMEAPEESDNKKSPVGGGVTNAGYSMDAAVDLHTGSIVFSEKGTLSDTYQWLLAEDRADAVKPCPGFCYTDLCVAKCYSITLGFALVSLIITVVMTVSSVPKLQAYRYTTGFLPTNCSTKKAEFHGHWEPCECSQRKSTYPCVQLYVSHGGMDKNSNETVQNLLIRSTEEDLISNLKCSYKPLCNCDKEVNRVKVVKFVNIYHDPAFSFACYYNPHNQSEVIRIQTLSESSEWGKMMVPASIFVICMVALFIVWILRANGVWSVIVEEKTPVKR